MKLTFSKNAQKLLDKGLTKAYYVNLKWVIPITGIPCLIKLTEFVHHAGVL